MHTCIHDHPCIGWWDRTGVCMWQANVTVIRRVGAQAFLLSPCVPNMFQRQGHLSLPRSRWRKKAGGVPAWDVESGTASCGVKVWTQHDVRSTSCWAVCRKWTQCLSAEKFQSCAQTFHGTQVETREVNSWFAWFYLAVCSKRPEPFSWQIVFTCWASLHEFMGLKYITYF